MDNDCRRGNMKASTLAKHFTAAILGAAAVSGIFAFGDGALSHEATASGQNSQTANVRLTSTFNNAPAAWSKRSCIVRGRGWVICYRNDYDGDQPPDWNTDKYAPYNCAQGGYKVVCIDGRSYRN